ncbi:hypothetical protein DITRI_Ditri09bG0137000 [Diplodiscus trichospermus]
MVLAFACVISVRCSIKREIILVIVCKLVLKDKNGIVFKGGKFDVDKIIDLSKLRYAKWVMVKWPHLHIGFQDVINCPNNIVISSKSMTSRTLATWLASPYGAVKFHVDGASKRKLGSAGIGGILRNHMGIEKIQFSNAIRVVDRKWLNYWL